MRALQAILTQMGYLRRDREPSVMCEETCSVLRHFQKCYGLSDTGDADEETLQLVERPRCGVPDVDPASGTGSGPAPFVLRGCEHPRTDLTFGFVNSTPDLPVDRQRDIFREAFDGIQAIYGMPSSPIPIRGQLSGTGDNQLHRLSAPPGRLTVQLRGPSGQDFDLYVRSGLPPTRSAFDARGFSGAANEEVRLAVFGGDVFVLVDSWRGSGMYELEVRFG